MEKLNFPERIESDLIIMYEIQFKFDTSFPLFNK